MEAARVLSLLQMRVRVYVPFLAAAICLAQEAKLPDEPVYSFGITAVGSSGLKGDIYLLKEGTEWLPNFKKLKPIGSVYTPALNIPTRDFREGFPGVTDRFEWFAIDYNGRFWISKPGSYGFALTSDDGSKLYIDGRTIIDNDGTHPPTRITGTAKLKEGIHRIRISYYQGPRHQVALILAIARPGKEGWYIFNTNNFRPPAEKFKDGSLGEADGAGSGKRSKRKPRE
jgi:hypothetical protein